MKKLVLLSALVFGLVFYSCSSDDDQVAPEKVELAGDWQLTNVDFTVMSEDGGMIRATDNCIMELIAGYRFFNDNSFFFILKAGSPFPTEGDYWKWEGSVDNFKILQPNLKKLPYNFSVTPTKLEVKKVNGKDMMTFHSTMGHGSEANFTLVKIDEIDQSKLPKFSAPGNLDYEYCNYKFN